MSKRLSRGLRGMLGALATTTILVSGVSSGLDAAHAVEGSPMSGSEEPMSGPMRAEEEVTPAPAPAPNENVPSERVSAPKARVSAGIYDGNYKEVFPTVTSRGFNLDSEGRLTIGKSRVEVTLGFRLPNGSGPQTSFEFSLNQDFWSFVSFSGLELKNDAGVTLAIAKANAEILTVTPTAAAERLEDVSGTFTFFIDPLITTEERTGVLNLLAPNGIPVGPGDSYRFYKRLPNVTGAILSPSIIPDQELVIINKPQYVDPSVAFDPKTFSVVIRPKTIGTLPICDEKIAPITATWFDSDRITSGDVDGIPIAKCSGSTLTLSLPTGVPVPKGTAGVRFSSTFVVDRPLTDYEFAYTFQAGTKKVELERSAESGVLAGVSAGEQRPARTDLSMEVVPPKGGAILVGDSFDYKVTTRSAEQLRTAYDLTTKQQLPLGVEFISATDGGKYDSASRTVIWPARDVKAGDGYTYKVTVKTLKDAPDSLKSEATNSGENTCYTGDTTGSVCKADATAKVLRSGIELKKKTTGVEDTNKNEVTGDAGDTIHYEFTIKNTGGATESSVLLSDPLLGIKDKECLNEPLPAGDTTTCTGKFKHVITKDEALTGEVINTATARIPDGPESSDKEKTPTVSPAFNLQKEILKTEDTNNNGITPDTGDTIHYEFTIKNTGNTTIKTIKLTDPLLKIENKECLLTPLKPGASAQCAGEFKHTITKEQATTGTLTNTATATSPGAPKQEATAKTPTLSPAFNLQKEILKTEDTNNNGITPDTGDTIHYEFTIKNTGNTTIKTIKLTDPLLGVHDKECLNEPLPAGETTTCAGEFKHTITKEQATTGTLTNTATATSPGAPKQVDEVTVKTTLAPKPDPEVEKEIEAERIDRPTLADTGVPGVLLMVAISGGAITVLGGLLVYGARRKKM